MNMINLWPLTLGSIFVRSLETTSANPGEASCSIQIQMKQVCRHVAKKTSSKFYVKMTGPPILSLYQEKKHVFSGGRVGD